jgi:glucose-1-phosphatase
LSDTRCMFLDMGKVLLDFDFKRLAGRMHSLTGCGMDSLRSAITGGDLAIRFELGLIGTREFHSAVSGMLGCEIAPEAFEEAWNSIFLEAPLLPDNLLSALSRKTPLWVLSNTNTLHFEFIEANYSFLQYFSGRILSFEVGKMKPDPEIFRFALDKAKVEPREALFVDDHLPNVAAATSVGIDAFQFLNPSQFVEQMNARQLI